MAHAMVRPVAQSNPVPLEGSAGPLRLLRNGGARPLSRAGTVDGVRAGC